MKVVIFTLISFSDTLNDFDFTYSDNYGLIKINAKGVWYSKLLTDNLVNGNIIKKI